MKPAAGKDLAKHVIRPARVILAGPNKVRYGQLIIIIHILWKVLKVVAKKTERRMVGNRMILVSR